jgi:hypothetical protein
MGTSASVQPVGYLNYFLLFSHWQLQQLLALLFHVRVDMVTQIGVMTNLSVAVVSG